MYDMYNIKTGIENQRTDCREKKHMRGIIYFCLFVVLILMGCLLRLLILYGRLRRQQENLTESFYQLQKMNETLRGQRHDYLNHMQVVYGMLELGEYQELKEYLGPIYKNLMKTGKAIRTSIPAVNALLMAKLGEAEKENIDFYIEVKSDLKELQIEPWELCKVLSNLIDNGLTALTSKEGERKLILDISETKETYLFQVGDNGPPIPEELRTGIFSPGVTTKTGEGHGMGLYIVAKVLKENGGTIRFSSDEKQTVFAVEVKKGGEGVWEH